MTATVQKLLSAFEALPPSEKQQLASEILRRTAGTDGIPNQMFDELAGELFGGYDAEEASGGQS